MSREHDGWSRQLWESEFGEQITGTDLESLLREYIYGEIAGQHFTVSTLEEFLQKHERVRLNPRTLRQFVNRLVGTGEAVIVRDGRGRGSTRVYCSSSELASPILEENAILAEHNWDQAMSDFADACRSVSTRSIKARRIG